MVESFVVDASVVAKWFSRGEDNENEARILRDAWSNGSAVLYAPAQLQFEVINSIWKNPGIDLETACSLARLAVRLSPARVDVGEDLAEDAMALARSTKLTYYDTVYVVLAKSLEHPLISADSEQLSIAEGYCKALHLAKVRDELKG